MTIHIGIRVPDIGDFRDVDVSGMMVKFNDRVVGGEQSFTRSGGQGVHGREVSSSAADFVKKLRVMVGDKVSQDSRQDPVPVDGR